MIDKYIVSSEVSDARREVCRKCEHKTVIGTCDICHCVIVAKTRLSLSECPIKKWGKIEIHEDIL